MTWRIRVITHKGDEKSRVITSSPEEAEILFRHYLSRRGLEAWVFVEKSQQKDINFSLIYRSNSMGEYGKDRIHPFSPLDVHVEYEDTNRALVCTPQRVELEMDGYSITEGIKRIKEKFNISYKRIGAMLMIDHETIYSWVANDRRPAKLTERMIRVMIKLNIRHPEIMGEMRHEFLYDDKKS